MKNIAVAALLSALAAVGTLAACGGGTPEPASPDTSAASASAAAASSAAAPATSAEPAAK